MMKRIPATECRRGGLEVFLKGDNSPRTAYLVNRSLYERFKELFDSKRFIIYPGGEPTFDAVLDLKKETRNVDALVAVGGGSVLDTAKLLTLDFESPDSLDDIIEKRAVPDQTRVNLIAFPATAGTGSEATSIAVVENRTGDLKVGVVDDRLIPHTVCLDSDLLSSLPKPALRWAGLDAIVHAMEAYLSVHGSPVSRKVALSAFALLLDSFIPFEQGDSDAAESMLYGSFLAGCAFNFAGVGLVHALAYPIGADMGVPHGLANGVLLPSVMTFNFAVNECPSDLQLLLRHHFGHDWLRGLEAFIVDREAYKAFVEYPMDQFDPNVFADSAITIHRLLKNNIRPVASASELEDLYKHVARRLETI